MIKAIFENLFKPVSEDEQRKRFDALSDEQKREGADMLLHMHCDMELSEVMDEAIWQMCERFGLDKEKIDRKEMHRAGPDTDAIADILMKMVDEETAFKLHKEYAEDYG